MRVFIVGNGPSLNKTPLEKLRGEYSWGVNRIHLIYPKTSWRPTYITFAEMTAGGAVWFPKIWGALKANPQAKKFARDDGWWYRNVVIPHPRERNEYFLETFGLNLFNACTHHDVKPGDVSRVPLDWHLPQICKFGGSVPMTIQLAVLEGFDEIYLIGCDLGHKAGSKNHFDNNYGASSGAIDNLNIDSDTAYKRGLANWMGHMYAQRNSPVPIYNATVGGSLEVYERVDFGSLF